MQTCVVYLICGVITVWAGRGVSSSSPPLSWTPVDPTAQPLAYSADSSKEQPSQESLPVWGCWLSGVEAQELHFSNTFVTFDESSLRLR